MLRATRTGGSAPRSARRSAPRSAGGSRHGSLRSTRALAAATTIALLAAACSTGDSATDAGRDDATTLAPAPATDADTTAPTDATPTTPTDSDPGSTDSAPSTDPDSTTDGDPPATDQPPSTDGVTSTTTPSLLADLPSCPVGALDTADGPVELTMWFGLNSELEAALSTATAEFNASQDRVVVTIENQTDYEATIDKYIQLSVDSRPDILLAPEFIVQSFAQSDTFIPVDACMEASGFDRAPFLERPLDVYSFEGVQWAMPFNVSNPVLYYNRKMFEAAGLDPDDPPLTFDELRTASQQIVDSGAATFGLVDDTSRDGAAGAFEQWFGRAREPFADNGNGRLAPATEVFFDNETGVEIMTFLRDMHADGLAVSVGENSGGQDNFFKMIDPVAPGAMTVSTSAAISAVLAALGSGIAEDLTVDDIGVGFMPGPSDEAGAQVGGAALWIPDGKGDAKAAAAWEFIQYLVAAQTQSTWAASTGYVPIRSDALELDPIMSLYAADGRYRVAYDQLLSGADDPAAVRPLIGPQREVRQTVADVIATIYSDPAGADIPALLAAAAERSNSLIATYNDLND